MDLLELSLRAAISGRAEYLPYAFDGEWSDEDRAIITAAIAPHVPERVDSMFNNWGFWQYPSGGFGAKRSTWDMGMYFTHTAAEMAAKITEYYTRER
jgi:hypothetical protein